MQPEASFPDDIATIGIETVNFCNARCPFCPLFQGEVPLDRKIRPVATMSSDLFRDLVVQIASWPALPNGIFLNMDGEPLIDRLFLERLKVLNDYGISQIVELQTNAEYLDKIKARKILENKIRSIVVGFDGSTKETYERHRVKCHYNLVLKNIKRFVSLRKSMKANTRVAIKYVMTPQNLNEIYEANRMFSAILDPNRDVMFASTSLNWGSVKLEKLGFILDRMEDVIGAPKRGCEIFESQLIVLADGRIPVCCFDYNLEVLPGSLADASKTPLLEIWRNENRRRLWRTLSSLLPEDKPAKCRECTFSYVRKPIDLDKTAFKKLIITQQTNFGLTLKLG